MARELAAQLRLSLRAISAAMAAAGIVTKPAKIARSARWSPYSPSGIASMIAA